MRISRSLAYISIAATLAILGSSGSVEAKRSKQSARATSEASSSTAPAKDVAKSLDELLSSPVKSSDQKEDGKNVAQPAQSTGAPDIAQPRLPERLQGTVEHTGETAPGQALSGKSDTTGGALSGRADENGPLRSGVTDAGQAQPLQPKLAPAPVLKGAAVVSGSKLGAQQQDPDLEDRELMVEWDRWRNRFLRAVQLQVQAGVNHPDEWEEETPRSRVHVDPYSGTAFVEPRFPMGTEAWFTCEITSDRRIKSLSIVRSSGIAAYDKAVLEGVRALEGTSMLQYPPASRRALVTQTAGIRTAESSDYQYHRFGDVERVKQQ